MPKLKGWALSNYTMSAPPAQKVMWLVYYKRYERALEGKEAHLAIIGIVESEEAATAMVQATQRHEANEGWDHPPIAVTPLPVGTNLVIDGEEGPLYLILS